MAKRAWSWIFWWVGALAFYLLLAWKVSLAEVLLGCVAAALTATVAVGAGRRGMAHFAPDRRWAARARRLPSRTVGDTFLLARALIHHSRGTRPSVGDFRVVALDSGGDDARSAARRAFVVAGLTVTPNTIVVSFDADADHMLVHQLVPDDGESIRATLGRP